MSKYIQQLGRTIKNIKQYFLNRGAKETFTVTPMTLSDKALQDKTVLITGGNSGIGLCIAERMSKIGANIIITGRDEEKIKIVESAIPNCKGILWDISDASIAHDKMTECWNCWGG